ncbi:MAG: ABC transporter substrate-binding protein [Chloroflexi bacterium]|nr:ABC transporter substrate-binding protein [Chloroflexota bacterium]
MRIGAIYNLEGAQSSLDIPSANGAKLAVKELNESGGIRGRRVELLLYDGKSDRDTIERATRRLVENAGVPAVIGFSDTDMVLYAAPIAAGAGVVFLTSGATSPKLPDQVKDYLFLTAFGDNAQAGAAADYALRELKLKTAYLLMDMQMEYTVLLSDHFRKRYTEIGGSVVLEDRYYGGDRDFSRQVARLKQVSPAPDMLYIASGPDDIGVIVKQFRTAGITQPFFGGDAYDTPLLVETAGGKAHNVYFTTHSLLAGDSLTEQQRTFVAAYEARYGNPPENAFAALGYDAVMVVADAMRRTRSDASRSVLFGLSTTRNFPGVTGNISYDNGSRIPRKEVTIVAVKNGQFTLAARVLPEPPPSQTSFPIHSH